MSDYLKRLNALKTTTQGLVEKETGDRKKRILTRKVELVTKMIEDIQSGEKPFFQSGFLSTTRGKVQL